MKLKLTRIELKRLKEYAKIKGRIPYMTQEQIKEAKRLYKKIK